MKTFAVGKKVSEKILDLTSWRTTLYEVVERIIVQ